MNKFDKYYLKQGKLELSMLDEDDERQIEVKAEEKEIHHEDDNIESREARIKLTDDIYNTLQTMGKFLTKKVGDEELVDTKKVEEVLEDEKENPIAPKWSKIIKHEAIKSVQARQLEEAVKSVYAKAAEEVEEIDIKLSKPTTMEETVTLQEEPKMEEKQTVVNAKVPVIFEDGDCEDKELAQSSIDQILLEYFGESQPQYEYAKRLKRHIDKKIALIENYQ